MALRPIGDKEVVSSGTADTAAAQIPSIQAAIAAKAAAIVIAGNDPSRALPVPGQAQAAGIKVVSFDSDVYCPNHVFINQANTQQIGTSEVDLLAPRSAIRARSPSCLPRPRPPTRTPGSST